MEKYRLHKCLLPILKLHPSKIFSTKTSASSQMIILKLLSEFVLHSNGKFKMVALFPLSKYPQTIEKFVYTNILISILLSLNNLKTILIIPIVILCIHSLLIIFMIKITIKKKYMKTQQNMQSYPPLK